MHWFWDIRLVTQWPWNPGYGSLKVIGTDTDRFATYDFLLTFHSNYGPISYHFRVLRRFQLKIAKFSHLFYFAPAEGVALGIGYWRWGQKTRMMGQPCRKKSLTIAFAVWIECTNVTDRWMDGRTDTRRQQRPRLWIVLHGKNSSECWTLYWISDNLLFMYIISIDGITVYAVYAVVHICMNLGMLWCKHWML